MSSLKKVFAAILSVLILCASLITGGGIVTKADNTPFWAQDGVLRILAIGNSFSIDTLQYVSDIAKSCGVTNVELGNLYIGGCSVATHAKNAKNDAAAYTYYQNTTGTWKTTKEYKMSDALTEGGWDFISMQQASTYSGMPDSFGDLDYLIGYVREKANSDARLVWNMTWAYQQNSTLSGFANYNNDQMTMYNAILSALENVIDTKNDIVAISPTGTAIQNARTSFMGDNLTRDGYHLTYDLGRYTAGLTFFSTLTGISIENIEYAPTGVDSDMKAVAIESAKNALAKPRTITNSTITSIESGEPHTHCVCGQAKTGHEIKGDHTEYSGITYEPWMSTKMPTAGNYYLYTNIMPAAETTVINNKDYNVAVNVSGNLNICLNGHTITLNKTMYMFYFGTAAISKGSVFNICDCKGGGKIINSSTLTYSFAFFYLSSLCTSPYTVNIYGGTYTAKNTKGYSSVMLGSCGEHKTNFYGGTFVGDTGEGYKGTLGGLIRVQDNSVATVWDGTFTGSDMSEVNAQGSAFFVAGKGTLNINGGNITGGELKNRQIYKDAQNKDYTQIGGTVFAGPNTTLNINGGTITGGKVIISKDVPDGAKSMGTCYGNCIFSSGKMTVTGGTINAGPTSLTGTSGNSKGKLGGAICKTGSALTITGGTINAYNKGTGYTWGGAIYANNGSLRINGNPVIHGAYAYKGGAIYVSGNGNSINLTEGGIIDVQQVDTLPEYGGAIYVESGTLNITGCGTITGSVGNSGSNLYVQGGTVTVNGAALSGTGNNSVVYTKSGGKLNLTANTEIDGTVIAESGSSIKITGFTGSVKALATSDGESGQIGLGWDADYIADGKVKINPKEYTYTYTDGTVTLQKYEGIDDEPIPGDLNNDGFVTDEDAVYLLFYTFFSDDYPLNQECDFNGDGFVTDEDAVYLLFHTFFPNDYLLRKPIVSILGDSISTLSTYIPEGNRYHYKIKNENSTETDYNYLTFEETWWGGLITDMEWELGVNDSWAASHVVDNYDNGTTSMVDLRRIKNLGKNGKPDYIFFYGGTNDAGHKVTLGTFDPEMEAELEEGDFTDFSSAYTQTILRLKHFYPNAKIIAITPNYTTGYYTNATLDNYVNVMEQVCSTHDIQLIDLRKSGLDPHTCPDGTHPDKNGMAILKEYIKSQIQ